MFLPRNSEESDKYYEVIYQKKDLYVDRLDYKNSPLAHYLLSRYYFNILTIPLADGDRKELKSRFIKINAFWKYDNQKYLTPFIKTWNYYITWQDLPVAIDADLFQSKENIILQWQSMKALWYTKEALQALSEKNSTQLESALSKLNKNQENLNREFLWFFSRRFIELFEKDSTFLSKEYFDPTYVEFIQQTLRLQKTLSLATIVVDDSFKNDLEWMTQYVESNKLNPTITSSYVMDILRMGIKRYEQSNMNEFISFKAKHPLLFSLWQFKDDKILSSLSWKKSTTDDDNLFKNKTTLLVVFATLFIAIILAIYWSQHRKSIVHNSTSTNNDIKSR